MEVVFIQAIGAGIAVLSSTSGPALPEAALARSLDLVRHLAATPHRPAVDRIVERAVRDLWTEWRFTRQPAAELSSYLAAIVAVLAAHRAADAHLADVLTEARRLAGTPEKCDRIATRMASDLVLSARTSGRLASLGVQETHVFFLMSRLLGSLLRDADTLAALAGEVAAFHRPAPATSAAAAASASSAEGAPAPRADAGTAAAAAAAEVALVAEAFTVPLAALAAAIAADPQLGAAHAPSIAAIEAKAVLYLEIETRLRAAADEPDLAAAAATFASCCERLAEGDLAAAEDLLAEAERAPDPALVPVPGTVAAPSRRLTRELRCLRGQIAGLAGDWPRAARQYGFALTLVPADDRRGRWAMLLAKAHALVEQGTHDGSNGPLVEAAQIYAEAGGLLSESAAPEDWAAAHVDLGNLLLLLGEREERPERFLAAALHFKPAVGVYSRLGLKDRWAMAQLGLGEALQRTGALQGDLVTLSDAAMAYRAALGVLTRQGAPADWAAAKLGLGEVLVRIAEEAGDTAVLAEAIGALRPVAVPGAAADLELTRVEAALGRAYVASAAETEDETLLEQAVALLERALDQSVRALSAGEAAALNGVLGTALVLLGERRGQVRLIEDAVRAKLTALDLYEAAGDEASAIRLRDELDLLGDVLEGAAAVAPSAMAADRPVAAATGA